MVTSIPASSIVNVTPNVIDAGGTGLDLSGLALTTNTRVPIGSVFSFATLATVAAFFGASSSEANFASRYFNGYDGAPIRPAVLLFMQYPLAAVPGYLRGGSLAAVSLETIKTVNGTITLDINGDPVTSATINLAGATSLSNAAALIQTGIAHNDAAFTGSIATNVLTVTAVSAGEIAVGQVVKGAGVTVGTTITGLGTGTGGTGTYTVDTSQTAASGALTSGATTVVYDPVSAAFVITGGTPGAGSTIGAADVGASATTLKLTAAAGAVESIGADATTPGDAMAAVVAETQNFVSFTTVFAASTDDMVAFASWANDQHARYLYVMWDSAVADTTPSNSSTALGQVTAADYGSVLPVFTDVASPHLAAFVMGSIASVDFSRTEGRINVAFLAQTGLTPTVTSQTIADQLEANGSNFYGRYATANDGFTFFYPGQVTGPFQWADSFINEVWMTNQFQLALMTLLTSIRSIPYNDQGYALIEAALTDPINAAVNFGAIRAGVPLSALQAAEINTAAGAQVSDTITERGWYLQVAPASPQVRAARGSPPITLWYTDGQSVQRINLNSVEVQ